MEKRLSLYDIKDKVTSLKGQNISLKINKGRNKIVSLTATIDQVYPSMFVITPQEPNLVDRKSYSYNDVLCGDVVFCDE